MVSTILSIISSVFKFITGRNDAENTPEMKANKEAHREQDARDKDIEDVQKAAESGDPEQIRKDLQS